MTRQDFDDETLMAFADGELDDATTAEVEAALETDDALAERVALFLDSRRLVALAMKPLVEEPVPEALAASVRAMAESRPAENVVPFAPRPTIAPAPQSRWMMPVAASILVVVAGVGGYALGLNTAGPSVGSNAEIAGLLDTAVSGGDASLGASAGSLRILASFRDGAGNLCREYIVTQSAGGTVTIACREDNNWATRLAMAVPASEGYTPASAQETLDTYLSSIDAGAPLGKDEEREALSAPR